MKKQRVEKITKSFKVDGTFESLYAAEGWLNENGYCYGSLCGNSPVAIMKGSEYTLPQKWKNFSTNEKSSVDGVMISSDFRESEVTVIIYI